MTPLRAQASRRDTPHNTHIHTQTDVGGEGAMGGLGAQAGGRGRKDSEEQAWGQGRDDRRREHPSSISAGQWWIGGTTQGCWPRQASQGQPGEQSRFGLGLSATENGRGRMGPRWEQGHCLHVRCSLGETVQRAGP